MDDLQDLYSELRGSRSAPPIMDARALFLERQMQGSWAKLDEAYTSYCESRQRILRQDPDKQVDAKAKDRDQQIRRLKRKQEKAQQIIKRFEELLPQLKKLADKQQSQEARKAKPAESKASRHVRPASITPDFIGRFSELIGDRQLDLVSLHFGFKPLADISDVQSDAAYLLREGDRCLLIAAEDGAVSSSELVCRDLCDRDVTVSLSHEVMVQLSVDRKLVLLQQQ
ncbi:hypothetical protein [Stieleria tagensis]|uniref:hypothetical protein n=1 Tax=Stieleria tagensis TaxID=2956795 RepID=UPI00209B181C|nr:hypothetical protein [Stieleria tagensis]